MSTGADCVFYEKPRGQWWYKLQRWPYGESPEYDKSGPFATYAEAERHLSDNEANPGGWSINAQPGCKHDLARGEKLPYGDKTEWRCDRCGASGPEVQAAGERWQAALATARQKQEAARTRYSAAQQSWVRTGYIGPPPALPRELRISVEELARHPKPLTTKQHARAVARHTRELQRQAKQQEARRRADDKQRARDEARAVRKRARVAAATQRLADKLGLGISVPTGTTAAEVRAQAKRNEAIKAEITAKAKAKLGFVPEFPGALASVESALAEKGIPSPRGSANAVLARTWGVPGSQGEAYKRLIMLNATRVAPLTDAQIHAAVIRELNAKAGPLAYVQWYRNWLKKHGHNPPPRY